MLGILPFQPVIVKETIKQGKKIVRAIKIAGLTGVAAAFAYGTLRLRAKIKKKQKEKQMQKQIAELYADKIKQRSK